MPAAVTRTLARIVFVAAVAAAVLAGAWIYGNTDAPPEGAIPTTAHAGR